MGTLITLHAHPDDEAILTGGTIARASDEGHRVVLVVATNGDHGEVPDDLAEGETLVDRRRAETNLSADALGIHRVAWLDYADSGMTGWEQNGAENSFHQADLNEAAQRLVKIIVEEYADDTVLTCYDWHGTYGHPDHIKVHHVGHRAAELAAAAGYPVRLMEATSNRDAMAAMIAAMNDAGVEIEGPDAEEGEGFDPHAGADDGNPFGEPESVLTLAVDVGDVVARKRAAIAAHASQVTDSSFFLQMPDEVFRLAFGTEWFIEADRTPPYRSGWIFESAG